MSSIRIALPSQERLHELFYCVGGKLISKVNHRERKIGDVVGSAPKKRGGYRYINVDGTTYRLHRVIYKWYYNIDLMPYEINHMDKNRLDNNIFNLEHLTERAHYDADSKGYTYDKQSGKWRVSERGKFIALCKTEEEAQEKVREVRAKR